MIPFIDVFDEYEKPKFTSGVSAWTAHLVFAYYLSKVLKPRRIVELGVHGGDSYCAWCQYNPQASVTGIDLWGEGPWTSDRDYLKVRKYADPLYGDRAILVQASFTDGLKYIFDNSCDLMHIDGDHTYENVKRDYEDALPKMEPSGIMVFHDTTLTQQENGVGKLWKEIIVGRPNFNFFHGYGLGILAVSDKFCPPAMRKFFEYANANTFEVERTFANSRSGDAFPI